MANVGPLLWFLRDNAPTSTIGWSAVTAWANGATLAAGVLRRQLATPTVGNERVFVVIIAGTTGGSEPTWVVTKGAKTTDNTITWMEVTGQPGVNGNIADSPTWLQNKNNTPSLGLIIYDSVSLSLQIVTTAGTTGNGAQPGFSATAGVTTADNSVTWTSLGLASGFAAWAAPFARLQATFTSTTWAQPGDTIFVGDDHSETQATVMALAVVGTTALPNYVYSIDHSLTLTLAGATLKAGGTITTTGNSAITFTGASFYLYGLTLSAGSGANAAVLNMNNSFNGVVIADTCLLAKAGTSAAVPAILSGGNSSRTYLINTKVQFGSTGDTLGSNGRGSTWWKNTPTAISGATIPATLISIGSGGMGAFYVDGVDLVALGANTIFTSANADAYGQIVSSKLAAGAVLSVSPAASIIGTYELVDCDSAGTNYLCQKIDYRGALSTETVVVRTGGASAGTPISHKLATSANSLFIFPFQSVRVAQWNAVTGTNRVVTLSGIWNAAALPNNDDIWIEAEYFGSAASPQASLKSNTKATNLAAASALPADGTSAWDSLVTARANTTAYVLGDVRKVATNPGRIFFCTTAGTSAGSEPGGYASAVDGGSVTDGSAVFRAGVRFTLTVTLSGTQPALAGPIYVTINAAKISSTWWVDPLIVLS